MNIKITKTDRLFSNFIRDRDGWNCQRCGKHYDKSNTSDRQGLHCSHYYSRGKKSVRFEPDNCIALCYGCHKLWGHGDERDKYEAFMRKKLGQTRWASLLIQSFQYHPKDDKMDKLIVEMLIKDYEKRKTTSKGN